MVGRAKGANVAENEPNDATERADAPSVAGEETGFYREWAEVDSNTYLVNLVSAANCSPRRD